MKIKLCRLVAIVLFASCAGRGINTNIDTITKFTPNDTLLANAANAPVVNMQYCFFHTEGTQSQDTTNVNITINGNNVTGKMEWIPKEKDIMRGTLAGTLSGNTIKALWAYKQEGVKGSIHVEFQLRGNALAQKPYIYNTETGTQTTNSKAEYTVIYNMKNCN